MNVEKLAKPNWHVIVVRFAFVQCNIIEWMSKSTTQFNLYYDIERIHFEFQFAHALNCSIQWIMPLSSIEKISSERQIHCVS